MIDCRRSKSPIGEQRGGGSGLLPDESEFSSLYDHQELETFNIV